MNAFFHIRNFRFLLFILLAGCLQNVFAQSDSAAYKKAELFFIAKDYDNALVKIDELLKSDSANKDYLLLQAFALFETGQYNKSYAAYTRVLELYPGDAAVLNNRAQLLNKTGNFEAAIKDFDAAWQLVPDDSTKVLILVNRGAAKSNLRLFAAAYEDYMRAYTIDSLNIAVLNNLATVADEVGKGDQTLKFLYKIITIDSTFIGAYANLGFKYQEIGDYKTAITFYDKVISIDSQEPLGYSNRAFNKYKLADLTGALVDVNQSLSLYETNSYAFRIRALILLAMDKTQEACADLYEAIRLGFTTMYGNEAEDLKRKHCK